MVQEGNKEQLIQAIKGLNRSASAEFLGQFCEADLRDYLSSLRASRRSYRTFQSPGPRRQPVAAH
jgi:hypothetical protein